MCSNFSFQTHWTTFKNNFWNDLVLVFYNGSKIGFQKIWDAFENPPFKHNEHRSKIIFEPLLLFFLNSSKTSFQKMLDALKIMFSCTLIGSRKQIFEQPCSSPFFFNIFITVRNRSSKDMRYFRNLFSNTLNGGRKQLFERPCSSFSYNGTKWGFRKTLDAFEIFVFEYTLCLPKTNFRMILAPVLFINGSK